MKLWRAWLWAGALWCGLAAGVLPAADPLPAGLTGVSFQGTDYVVRTVDPHKEDLRLYWNDDQGQGLRDFAGLQKYVESKGEHLVFAANAGMFEADSRPVGLLVQDSVEKAPLNLRDDKGNFYMKPNGVFLINEKHEAMVIESSCYTTILCPAIWATQSGPLMVQRGDIHPDFNADSKSRKLRSGVGIRKDGTVVFALSKGPVTFYEFAQFFVEKLKCPNALFLDGDVSAFYTPDVKDPMPHSFGPMFGLIEKSKPSP